MAALDDEGFRLSSDRVDARQFERRPGEVLHGRDVLGRGVIDVERGRLVRVRDLILEKAGDTWHVVALEASPPATLTGLLRRLPRREPPVEEVEWRHVEPPIGHVRSGARSSTYDDLIEAMLPAEWRWRGRPAAARFAPAGSAGPHRLDGSSPADQRLRPCSPGS